VADYPLQGRGGQGVITFKITSKTGDLISARMVNPKQELMLISEGGIVLRTAVEEISVQGRSTQGVTLMDIEEGGSVAAVTVVDMESSYKGETALPTGVSAEPGAEAGGKKKGKASAAKGGKAATAAKAGKTASSTRVQAKRPGSRSAAPKRKSPRKGR
jgi:DNA gyrase subunit A